MGYREQVVRRLVGSHLETTLLLHGGFIQFLNKYRVFFLKNRSVACDTIP